MRLEIKITGNVTEDPQEIVEEALATAIELGLVNADDAVYSYGRHQGLRVAPDRAQAQRHFEESIEADAADESKVALRAEEAAEAKFVEVDAVFTQEADDEHAAAPEAPEEELDESVEADPEPESVEVAAEETGQAAVLDVQFGSVAAARLADELNMTKDDFKRKRKSGVKGFTVGDVRKISAAREDA